MDCLERVEVVVGSSFSRCQFLKSRFEIAVFSCLSEAFVLKPILFSREIDLSLLFSGNRI
jgi:hypothetical protein